MKLAFWISLLGIVVLIGGGAMLMHDLNASNKSHAPLILAVGVLLALVFALGLSVVISLLGYYFR